MQVPLIPCVFMLSAILPERSVRRCLDSWAEPQQVYRLQFRGLAPTTAGDGRVMRRYDPTGKGPVVKAGTRGLSCGRDRTHQRFRTPPSLKLTREPGNSGLVQRYPGPAIKLTKLVTLGLIKGPPARELVITEAKHLTLICEGLARGVGNSFWSLGLRKELHDFRMLLRQSKSETGKIGLTYLLCLLHGQG